ncbi:MAG: hypothetical protein SFT94_05335 [Pseudanabaenaceae cyanobacterium bins.68]|nr:hypothetical protein [Pseudanabaenaceae cyanobacterium bins.68]
MQPSEFDQLPETFVRYGHPRSINSSGKSGENGFNHNLENGSGNGLEHIIRLHAQENPSQDDQNLDFPSRDYSPDLLDDLLSQMSPDQANDHTLAQFLALPGESSDSASDSQQQLQTLNQSDLALDVSSDQAINLLVDAWQVGQDQDFEQQAYQELTQELQMVCDQLEVAQQKIQLQEATMASLETEIERLKQEVNTKDSLLEEADQELEQLRTRLRRQHNHTAQLKAALEKQAAIARQASEVEPNPVREQPTEPPKPTAPANIAPVIDLPGRTKPKFSPLQELTMPQIISESDSAILEFTESSNGLNSLADVRTVDFPRISQIPPLPSSNHPPSPPRSAEIPGKKQPIPNLAAVQLPKFPPLNCS